MKRAVCIATLFSTLTLSAHADSLTYVNDRFGTRITFPVDVFDAIDPPPVNGDGRRFRSSDGAELAAYGQFNALDLTPKSLIDREKENAPGRGRTITYSASGSDWAVVSGIENGNTFYDRHEFADGVIHSMELKYPQLASALYDRLAGEIADTLDGPQ